MIMRTIQLKLKQRLMALAKNILTKKLLLSSSHTFTRTIALMDEFAEALDLADEVFLCNILALRVKHKARYALKI